MLSLKWRLSLMTALLAGLTLTACDDDDDKTPVADSGVVVACTPECGACEVCDTTGEAPMCVSTCGEGTTCQDGACVAEGGGEVTCEPGCGPCQVCDNMGACVDTCGVGSECVDGACQALPPPPTCDPACGACQACDTSGDAPACIDLCGAGAECQDGLCVPSAPPAACDPACGACEACDTSGENPVCVPLCGDGAQCTDGVCTPIPAPTCDPGCSPCQRCDVSGETPVCVDNCGDGLECAEGVCQAVPEVCDPECGPCQRCIGGACESTCGGSEVCIEGVCVRDSVHAGMEALAGPFATGPAVTAACLNCHQEQADHFLNSAHWKWAGPSPGLVGAEGQNNIGKTNLINNFCIAVPSNEARCTQCHAGYDWRGEDYDFQDQTKMDCLTCHAQPGTYAKAPTTAGNPTDNTNLLVAARSVGESKVANCGSCHFSAGGGDNVKKGDLGSHLLQATRNDDVHMGSGMECANCHAGQDHQIMGRSVHNVATNGPVNCTDCHGEAGFHANPMMDNHAQDIACQTCHIPAFSRNQPTKMNWDWSTAGNRTLGENGVVRAALDDGTMVTAYDAMKGDFVWMKDVRPEYGWWDGRATRMTITDQFPEGVGGEGNPIVLGKPVATHEDLGAKIWPFKVMRGRQAVDPARRLVIVPKLFGPGGFWGAIPAADAYTAEGVEALWASSLTAGAQYSGQIDANTSYAAGDWAWGYTEMWMGINHEVAPPAMALGCNDCHNGGAFDWEALGYNCDPMMRANCGSRH
ncbi:MAG: tetrathionate reductase family octaheme c-type cytochrome [Myxococcales bacterium]|nr:tetrathionate reductase family octaheme c-type cytochrome [Myxococcales bacterium]